MLETILAFLETQGPLIATTAILGTTLIVKVVQAIGRVRGAIENSILERSKGIDRSITQTVSAEFQVIMEHIKMLEEKAELDAGIQSNNPVLTEEQKQAYNMFKIKAQAMGAQAQSLITAGKDIFHQGKATIEQTKQLTEQIKDQWNPFKEEV